MPINRAFQRLKKPLKTVLSYKKKRINKCGGGICRHEISVM
nr:MAG TPA_asm: SWIM zinc finger protein [Caudoviricetes sp.]